MSMLGIVLLTWILFWIALEIITWIHIRNLDRLIALLDKEKTANGEGAVDE